MTPPFDQALDPGEELLWSGTPQWKVVVPLEKMLWIPGGVLWLIWVVGIFVGGLSAPRTQRDIKAAPVLSILCMVGMFVPFIAIGLYLIIGQFIGAARHRRGLHYGVTTNRILIMHEAKPHTIQSIALSAIQHMSLERRRDGLGTIWFHQHWLQPSTLGPPPVLGFELIPEVDAVARLIRIAQQPPYPSN